MGQGGAGGAEGLGREKVMMVEDMEVIKILIILMLQAALALVDMLAQDMVQDMEVMPTVKVQVRPGAHTHFHHLQDLHLPSGGSESLELGASKHHHHLLLQKMALLQWQSLNST